MKEVSYNELMSIIERDFNKEDLSLLKPIEICHLTNGMFKFRKCRICEGGGWYSDGRRYTYENYYCEL